MLIPDSYQGLFAVELEERIAKQKVKHGKDLVILGHHYQRDEILKFADFIGDSYKLSKIASEQKKAKYIVFCGVHFMAESAQILAAKGQRVFLPHMDAGCPMADMAGVDEVEYAWSIIASRWGAKGIVPITYMNSHATLKAFVGRNGGVVCTSSNAGRAFDWALKQGDKIFFFPDEHLGKNTARIKAFSNDEVAIWDPEENSGGIASDAFSRLKIIVWKGFCHVHTFFTLKDVNDARQKYPGCKVVVHPECPEEVVMASDASGSTEGIADFVKLAKSGSTIVVGTEINMVNRLAHAYPDKKIVSLNRSLCPNMFKISLNHLLWTLDNLPNVNEVIVEEGVRKDARVALERMLEV